MNKETLLESFTKLKNLIESKIALLSQKNQNVGYESLNEKQDVFEMANLYPKTTGLPMTIWVSPKCGARHDVRVKVNMSHGNKINLDNLAVVSVRPEPRVLVGNLSAQDQKMVFAWIGSNSNALIEFWDGRIDTADLLQRLKRYS